MTGEAWSARYLEAALAKLTEVKAAEGAAIARAAEAVAEALAGDGMIYVFGCGHSAMLEMDLFYRAGGLIPVQPIFDDRVLLDLRPVTETTQWEQREDWVREVFAASGARAGDVLICISTSGRNGAPIEMALAAREAGLTVIALTSRAYANASVSRHSSGKRLHEVADLVLDNHVDPGDAAVSLPGLEPRIGPLSTVIGSALLQATMVQVTVELLGRGLRPPVFVSANLPGGEEHNQTVLAEYRGRIRYLQREGDDAR
jgi:uncharacterized phosphosugar-binding protein